MTLYGDRRRLEGQVGTAHVVRQARLKPECAAGYPTLPADMWTSASCLAGLVAASSGSEPQPRGKSNSNRTLSPADFEFRGGFPRQPAGLPLSTRMGEPASN